MTARREIDPGGVDPLEAYCGADQASIILLFLAGSSAPTPLYAVRICGRGRSSSRRHGTATELIVFALRLFLGLVLPEPRAGVTDRRVEV